MSTRADDFVKKRARAAEMRMTMVSFKNHPDEFKEALHQLVCTTCEEMTLIMVQRLTEKEGHSSIADEHKSSPHVMYEPPQKKRCMSKCNECCLM